MVFDWIFYPEAWIALISLTAIEIVLGIDNVVFISVLVARLDQTSRERARRIGLTLALIFRIFLLFFLTWLIGLTEPVVTVWDQEFSWRDIVLIGGGLFLLTKATREVHAEIEGLEEGVVQVSKHAFKWAVAQVIVIDLVFSIDSIVTAIGMAQDIEVMILAVVIAVGVMYISSGPVSEFVAHYPTTKMLALAFLLLVGVALIADGMGFHIPRAYIYFAMAFSAGVEAFNVLARRNRQRRRATLTASAKPNKKRNNRRRRK
jgi:predicted tellurium resistance membrane protein TerC